MDSAAWIRAAPLLLAALSGVLMAGSAEPLTIPDSLEMIAEGGCMVGLEPASGICDQLNPAYWTPGWSIPVGILSLVLHPVSSAGVVSLLAMSLVVLPCWSLGARLGNRWAGAIAALLVVVTPALQTYGMLADGRGLALLCLFGAWALALRSLSEERSRLWAGLAGATAGLGLLVRPEGLLTLLLVPLFIGIASRCVRRGAAALGGGVCLAAPWWLALSVQRGRLTLTPRDWEATGFPLLEQLPKREVLELYGMGAVDTPLRELALQSEVRAEGAGLDIIGGISWLGQHLVLAVPWWALVGALVGLLLALRDRRYREISALILAVTPTLVAALKPQSRDVLLPMANLLPLVVCAWILNGFMLAEGGRAVRERLDPVVPPPLLLGIAGMVAVGFFGPRVDLTPSTELQDSGRQASAWLSEQGDVRVRASFESAPIVHLAGRTWDPWPSRWDPEAWSDPDRVPDYVLLTDLDDYAGPADVPSMTPVAYYGDDYSWVLVLRLDRP